MRLATSCLIFASMGLPGAQAAVPNPVIRSIRIQLDRNTAKHLSIRFEDVAGSWKKRGIDLAVEHRLDPAAIERAGAVIREMYARAGHRVRVDHRITPIPPRSVEVTFEVGEL